MHFDLTTMVTDNVSLLDVRNCFRSVAFDSVSFVRLATLFCEKQVKSILDADRGAYKGHYTRRDVQVYFDMTFNNPSGVSATRLGGITFVGETKTLLNKLITLGLIEEDNGRFTITRDGHSLRMQKSLKRIPLKRANDYLIKLVKVVDRINNDNEFFTIDAIFLFGSVINKQSMVGDIDLSVVLEQRNLSMLVKRDFRTLEVERKEIMKALRVTPYLSFINTYSLVEMYNDDSCKLNTLYLRGGFLFESLNAKPDINLVNTPMYDLK